MAPPAGQAPPSAAGRKRDVVELICVRCRRVIGLSRAESPGRAGPVGTIHPQALDARDTGAIHLGKDDPTTTCMRCGKSLPIHQAALLRGEILCPECAPPRLLPVRRRVERPGRAGPARSLGLCKACAGQLACGGGRSAPPAGSGRV